MFADGSLGVRRIWWLLRCSHLMVPLCVVVCPVGARLTAMCGAALCPVALLLEFLPISGSFFFCWHAHRSPLLVCGAGGQHVAPCLPIVAIGLSHFQLGGTRSTRHSLPPFQSGGYTRVPTVLGEPCGDRGAPRGDGAGESYPWTGQECPCTITSTRSWCRSESYGH